MWYGHYIPVAVLVATITPPCVPAVQNGSWEVHLGPYRLQGEASWGPELREAAVGIGCATRQAWVGAWSLSPGPVTAYNKLNR